MSLAEIEADGWFAAVGDTPEEYNRTNPHPIFSKEWEAWNKGHSRGMREVIKANDVEMHAEAWDNYWAEQAAVPLP